MATRRKVTHALLQREAFKATSGSRFDKSAVSSEIAAFVFDGSASDEKDGGGLEG